MYPNSSIWLFPLIFLWLIPCAWQDWRRREVSNWLTLPAIPIALGLRLLGWTNGNWWLTGIVSLSAIALWLAGGMGGADAKGWLAFALLGEWMILSAALGMLIWYSITWICRHIRKLPTTERIPGFPGYWLGVVSLLLLRFCFQL